MKEFAEGRNASGGFTAVAENQGRIRVTHSNAPAGSSGGKPELEIIGLQGGRRWMETHAVLLENADGSHAQLAVTRDISERKQAEKALKESEERLSRIVEGSNDVIWDWDFRNDRGWWNQRFNEILSVEIAEEERSLRAVSEYIHPNDQHLISQALEAHLERGENFEVEYRIIRSSGEIRYISK